MYKTADGKFITMMPGVIGWVVFESELDAIRAFNRLGGNDFSWGVNYSEASPDKKLPSIAELIERQSKEYRDQVLMIDNLEKNSIALYELSKLEDKLKEQIKECNRVQWQLGLIKADLMEKL